MEILQAIYDAIMGFFNFVGTIISYLVKFLGVVVSLFEMIIDAFL